MIFRMLDGVFADNVENDNADLVLDLSSGSGKNTRLTFLVLVPSDMPAECRKHRLKPIEIHLKVKIS